MKVVLAALDATQAARPVLRTAVEMARTLQTEARALHVPGDGDPQVPAALAAELGVPLHIAEPPPVAAIVAATRPPEVMLVTLALHRLPGRHHPGQTALAVTARIAKPVVVVPPEQPVRESPSRVLFPLDGTRRVSNAVRAMIRAYVGAGVEAIAVHVFEPATVPRFFDGPFDAAIWIDEFAAQHCAELGVRLEVRTGPPVPTLLDVAEAEDVDVIALGWRQDLSGTRSQVVRGLLTHSTRPVALVPFLDLRRPAEQGARAATGTPS